MQIASRFVLTALVGILFIWPDTSPAQSCSGNACDMVSLEKADGCMVVRNRSNKPVKVDHNVAGVSVGIAYANSAYRLMAIEGRCMTGFSADYKANYN